MNNQLTKEPKKLSEISPRFEHDCERCKFLGCFEYEDGQVYDLYSCGSDYGTVIARYGNEGHQYMSGLASAKSYLFQDGDVYHPLALALVRATIRGYITQKMMDKVSNIPVRRL